MSVTCDRCGVFVKQVTTCERCRRYVCKICLDDTSGLCHSCAKTVTENPQNYLKQRKFINEIETENEREEQELEQERAEYSDARAEMLAEEREEFYRAGGDHWSEDESEFDNEWDINDDTDCEDHDYDNEDIKVYEIERVVRSQKEILSLAEKYDTAYSEKWTIPEEHLGVYRVFFGKEPDGEYLWVTENYLKVLSELAKLADLFELDVRTVEKAIFMKYRIEC